MRLRLFIQKHSYPKGGLPKLLLLFFDSHFIIAIRKHASKEKKKLTLILKVFKIWKRKKF